MRQHATSGQIMLYFQWDTRKKFVKMIIVAFLAQSVHKLTRGDGGTTQWWAAHMPRLVEIISQQASDDVLYVRDIGIESFEQLRAATPTSNSEIIQIEAGRMKGRLKHATVAGLSLGFGAFSHGLISRGVYSSERVTIGFLFDSPRRPANVARINTVRAWSPGTEHERRHYGGASFGAISVSIMDMANFFGSECRFSDPSSWKRYNSFRTDPKTGAAGAEALRSIMAAFESRVPRITQCHAEFWKRAILEAAIGAIANTGSPDEFISSPTKLVRRAREIIEKSESMPVHISEISTALQVPRRSLHRAFDEVLGISPIKYLHRKRLCDARILLREPADAHVTVADVAFSQGFSDFGRFARYYRSLFGENPSETLNAARRGPR